MYRMCGLLLTALLMAGCANSGEYRFERIDGDRRVALPLMFEGFSGIRDGARVQVEGRFSNGADNVRLNFNVYLRPPAEFQSGSYQAAIEGRMNSGSVECPSLTFQGGQTALPTVGGVFILHDEQNRSLYRVTIPATTLTSRNNR